jgi:asparagine synthase (glutamine-hydrolysing)
MVSSNSSKASSIEDFGIFPPVADEYSVLYPITQIKLYLKQKDYTLEEALKEAEDILTQSIKRRVLSSDLEVGAFLSGGIDRGLIVAMASKYVKNLKTFTVSFDKSYDETGLAKMVANRYGTTHRVLEAKINLKDDLTKILHNYSIPYYDSSAIPSYYVSKEAKKYVSVILNGDGADEFYGGYRRYVLVANNLLPMVKKINFLRHILPKPHNKLGFYTKLYNR